MSIGRSGLGIIIIISVVVSQSPSQCRFVHCLRTLLSRRRFIPLSSGQSATPAGWSIWPITTFLISSRALVPCCRAIRNRQHNYNAANRSTASSTLSHTDVGRNGISGRSHDSILVPTRVHSLSCLVHSRSDGSIIHRYYPCCCQCNF